MLYLLEKFVSMIFFFFFGHVQGFIALGLTFLEKEGEREGRREGEKRRKG